MANISKIKLPNGNIYDIKDDYSHQAITLMQTPLNRSYTVYIDPINGDDTNDGLSFSVPLKTFSAFSGKYGYLSHASIYLINDVPIVNLETDNKIKLFNFDYINISSYNFPSNSYTINCQLVFQNCDKIFLKGIKFITNNQNYTATKDDDDESIAEYSMIKVLYAGEMLITNCEFSNDPLTAININATSNVPILSGVNFIHSNYRLKNSTFSGTTYPVKSSDGSIGSLYNCSTPADSAQNLYIASCNNTIFNYFNSNSIDAQNSFLENASFIMNNGLQKVTTTKDGIMSKEDKTKLDTINFYADQSIFNLTNEDLNTIVAPGFYLAGSQNSVTINGTTIPSILNNNFTSFGLIVIRTGTGNSTNKYCKQIIFSYKNAINSYSRSCSGTTWTEWTENILTDTTYNNLSAAENGTNVSLVSTGEKYLWNQIANIEKGVFSDVIIKSFAEGWSTFEGKTRASGDENSGCYIPYDKIGDKYYINEHIIFYHVDSTKRLQYIRLALPGSNASGLQGIIKSDVATTATVFNTNNNKLSYNANGYYLFSVGELFNTNGTDFNCKKFDLHLIGYIS